MRRIAVRLFTLAICAVALVAVPMFASAKAAADGKEMTQHRKTHKSQRVEQPKSSSPAQPYYANPADDPDRKASY